ncbi:MAG: hypothetical protein ACLUHC_06655 [Clostridia bacterium]
MNDNNKNQNSNFKFLKRRLNQYENYFHVLGLPYDESKDRYYTSEITEEKIDEQVKKLYDEKIDNLDKVLKGVEKNPELQKIKEGFTEKFEDAYNALKDRNSRKNYIDLLTKIKDDNFQNTDNKENKGEDEEWQK